MLKPLFITIAFTLAVPVTALAQATLPAAPAALPAAPAAPSSLLPPGQMQEKYKAYLYQHYAADRKALAVVRLFARRQTGGAIFLAVGASLLSTLAAVSGTHDSGTGQVTVQVSPLAYVLYPGPFVGVGIGKLSRFSNRRLYEALDSYDHTGILPNYVQGRLHEHDYQ
ncbi:MAG: hypothetical protein ACRYFK_06650 [Janthinobacterium lividum]